MTDDPLARDLRDAITARRPPASRRLAARLTAAAAGPRRPRILAPALLAGIVAIGALVVLATRPVERDQAVADVPMSPVVAAGGGGGGVAAPVGAPPDLAAYDAVLDESSSVAMSAAQRARIRAISEVLARDRATHRERKRTAEIDLRTELGRGAIDTVRAAAAYDRVAAEEAALGRVELIARLDVRTVLEPQQRTAIESRTPVPTQPTTTAARTQLSIVSAIPGTVYVDGKAVGTTPVRVTVSPGKHRVRVEYAGYESSDDTVEVGAGSTVTLRPDPPHAAGATGTLTVTATPFGMVTIDGKQIGETPMKVNLTPGRHKVNLIRNDPDVHVSRTAEVMIQAGKTTNLSLSLTGE